MLSYSQPGKLRLREGGAGQANRLDQRRPIQNQEATGFCPGTIPGPFFTCSNVPTSRRLSLPTGGCL